MSPVRLLFFKKDQYIFFLGTDTVAETDEKRRFSIPILYIQRNIFILRI